MSLAAEMPDWHGRVLAELAELGMSLARALHGRAAAAENDEAAERLACAFHRISRAVRMTLALEARLARQTRQDWREDSARTDYAVERRKAQVRGALAREVWPEHEGKAAERLLDELDERLGQEALADDFTQIPFEAQAARIRAELGLAASAAANDAEPARAAPPQAPPSPPRLIGEGPGPDASPVYRAGVPPGGWLG